VVYKAYALCKDDDDMRIFVIFNTKLQKGNWKSKYWKNEREEMAYRRMDRPQQNRIAQKHFSHIKNDKGMTGKFLYLFRILFLHRKNIF